MSFFITFEGGEGTGKTTQLQLLSQAFAGAGIACIITREPGGTPEAEEIRALLVNGEAGRWDPVTESLLFYAARTHHARTVIHPALAKGTHVICDRFMDSTLVYQGIGRGVGTEWIRRLHGLSVGALQPDLTLVLDIDVKEGLTRARQRHSGEDRFESMQLSFHQRVREGFLAIAEADTGRCAVVNAAPPPGEVHGQIIQTIRQRLGLALLPAKG